MSLEEYCRNRNLFKQEPEKTYTYPEIFSAWVSYLKALSNNNHDFPDPKLGFPLFFMGYNILKSKSNGSK